MFRFGSTRVRFSNLLVTDCLVISKPFDPSQGVLVTSCLVILRLFAPNQGLVTGYLVISSLAPNRWFLVTGYLVIFCLVGVARCVGYCCFWLFGVCCLIVSGQPGFWLPGYVSVFRSIMGKCGKQQGLPAGSKGAWLLVTWLFWRVLA